MANDNPTGRVGRAVQGAPRRSPTRKGTGSFRLRLACCLAAAVLGAPCAFAATDEGALPGLSLRGFGTLGMARTTTDQAEFVRDLSQPGGVQRDWSPKIDSILGVQANYLVGDQLEAVVQAVSRYRSDGSFRPEVSWAFLKYDPNPQFSWRVGRLGTEFYMLADSRLVGYSYLPIRPPGDYFGTLPFTYIDGADVAATAPFAAGLVRGKLFAGVSRESAPVENRQFDLNGSQMQGGHLDYQQGSWLWRLGYAQLRFEHELPPVADLRSVLLGPGLPASARAVADALSTAGTVSRFHSAGMSYDRGPLQLQLMASRTTHEAGIYQDTNAGYLIAAYRVNEFTPYVGRSWARSKARSLPSSGVGELDALVAASQARTHTDQFTHFLGVRWDFRRDMALKAQVDLIRGAPSSVYPFQWVTPAYDGRMNVYSLSLDFVF